MLRDVEAQVGEKLTKVERGLREAYAVEVDQPHGGAVEKELREREVAVVEADGHRFRPGLRGLDDVEERVEPEGEFGGERDDIRQLMS